MRHLAPVLTPPLQLVNLTTLTSVGRPVVGSGKEMSPGEVATRLRVSHSTVIRWEDSGELVPSQRLPSGWRRYDPADVEALETVLVMSPGPERDEAMAGLKARNLARRESGRG